MFKDLLKYNGILTFLLPKIHFLGLHIPNDNLSNECKLFYIDGPTHYHQYLHNHVFACILNTGQFAFFLKKEVVSNYKYSIAKNALIQSSFSCHV